MMEKENNTEKKKNSTSTGSDAANAVNAVDAIPQLLSLDQFNVERKQNNPNRDSLGLLARIKGFARQRPPPTKPRRQPSRRPPPRRRRGGEVKERVKAKAKERKDVNQAAQISPITSEPE